MTNLEYILDQCEYCYTQIPMETYWKIYKELKKLKIDK